MDFLKKHLHIEDNDSQLIHNLADRVAQIASESIEHHGQFDLAMPAEAWSIRLIEQLAQRRVSGQDESWNMQKTRIYLTQSITSVQQQAFLSAWQHDGLQGAAIQLLDPANSKVFEEDMLQHLATTGDGGVHFDLILLNCGAEGQIAGLSTQSKAMNELEHLVFSDGQQATLTLPVFESARYIILLAEGANRAAVVRETMTGAHPKPKRPVQSILHIGVKEWFVDAAAGADIPADLWQTETTEA